jgi:hypothetical protein
VVTLSGGVVHRGFDTIYVVGFVANILYEPYSYPIRVATAGASRLVMMPMSVAIHHQGHTML